MLSMLPFLQVTIAAVGPSIIPLYAHLVICFLVYWLAPGPYHCLREQSLHKLKYQLTEMVLSLTIYIALRRLNMNFSIVKSIRELFIPMTIIPAYLISLIWYFLSINESLTDSVTYFVRLAAQLLLLSLLLYGCYVVIENAINASHDIHSVLLVEKERKASEAGGERPQRQSSNYCGAHVEKATQDCSHSLAGQTMVGDSQLLTQYRPVSLPSNNIFEPCSRRNFYAPDLVQGQVADTRHITKLIRNNSFCCSQSFNKKTNNRIEARPHTEMIEGATTNSIDITNSNSSNRPSRTQQRKKARISPFNHFCLIDKRMRPFDWAYTDNSDKSCLDQLIKIQNPIAKLGRKTKQTMEKLNSSPI
ncbi:hypothetical protein TRVA0_036S00694 [Trichomonascus vanleenenianus]|uniref:uncharacterized protein n=1 Tax=Trichomonascus vanleenenianus TaxID=2268995 RepID=UPI003ECB4A12